MTIASFKSVLCVGIVLILLTSGCTKVVNEITPDRIQEKYEWFKDASAALDSKVATIHIYELRLNRLEQQYNGTPRKDWARSDLNQYAVWESEIGGIKASYNLLASEYNAEMSKWNWRFCNVGGLPEGATKVLPREYKPYMEE